MWIYLGGRQGITPRYTLIEKNGRVFRNDAARPSEGEKLVEQINSLISVRDFEAARCTRQTECLFIAGYVFRPKHVMRAKKVASKCRMFRQHLLMHH